MSASVPILFGLLISMLTASVLSGARAVLLDACGSACCIRRRAVNPGAFLGGVGTALQRGLLNSEVPSGNLVCCLDQGGEQECGEHMLLVLCAILRPSCQVCDSVSATGECHLPSFVGCRCLREEPPFKPQAPSSGPGSLPQHKYYSDFFHVLPGGVTLNLALAQCQAGVGLLKKCFCKGDYRQEAV